MTKTPLPSLNHVFDAAEKIIPKIRTPLSLAALSVILIFFLSLFAALNPAMRSPLLSALLICLSLLGLVTVALVSVQLYRGKQVISQYQYTTGEFDTPVSITHFAQGPVSESGEYNLVARRFTTIRSLGGGDLRVCIPMFSHGKIKSAISLSDPDRMSAYTSSSAEGLCEIEILSSKPGEYFLIVLESEREVKIGAPHQKPNPSNLIMRTLLEKVLRSNLYSFFGTRTIAPTQYVRIVLQFAKGSKPKRLHPVEVTKHGVIVNREFVVADLPERDIYVAELQNPETGGGVYIWWKWDNVPPGVVEGSAISPGLPDS